MLSLDSEHNIGTILKDSAYGNKKTLVSISLSIGRLFCNLLAMWDISFHYFVYANLLVYLFDNNIGEMQRKILGLNTNLVHVISTLVHFIFVLLVFIHFCNVCFGHCTFTK